MKEPEAGNRCQQLVSRLSSDPADEAACAGLIRHVQCAVESRLRRLPPSDRGDVLQDICIRLLRVIPCYDPERARFDAVVQGCARLAVLQFWRTRQHQPVTAVGRTSDCSNEAADLIAEIPGHDQTPEQISCRSEILCLAMRRVFVTDSPPHQSIGFGYVKLLEWEPRKVAEERESWTLGRCSMELAAKYHSAFPHHQPWSGEVFCDFHRRLEGRVIHFIGDPKARSRISNILNQVARDTRIGDYFDEAGDKAAQVAHWWYSVRRRMLDSHMQA